MAEAAKKMNSTPPFSATLYDKYNSNDPIQRALLIDDDAISNVVGFGLTKPAMRLPPRYERMHFALKVNACLLPAAAPSAEFVQAPVTAAEAFDPNSYGVDFLSNGFKIRNDRESFNQAGATVVWAAFGENPFAGSNVAPVNAR